MADVAAEETSDVTATAVTTTTGGSTSAEATSQTTEQLVGHAHVILDACGRTMSPSRVRRVVREYQRSVERNGWVFWDYFANAMLLTNSERRRLVINPDIERVISYLDPTGERAVNNVMRQRRG